MPSPFPGMDPYLEHPDWFPDLHGSLIIHMKETIQHSLPESYSARSGYHFWLEAARRTMQPDVDLVRVAGRPRRRDRGGVVLAEPRPTGPLVIAVDTIDQGPTRQSFIEIRRRRGKEVRLVASIEILSPSNKKAGHTAREQYLDKQRQVLRSDTHLIEIDLSRGGSYTAAVPRELVAEKAGPFDYLVSIHRFDRPSEFLVYSFAMQGSLPEIAIPLLPGDPDVMLDLQAVFNRAYDGGAYGQDIEYGKDPIVPRLKADQAAWAADLLKKRKGRV